MPSRFINSDTQYVPFVRPYVQGANQEYFQKQKELQGTYDENVSHYDALQEAADNMQSLNAPGDIALKKEAYDAARKDIESAAKSGDYENHGRLVRKAVRDFSTKYKPIAEQIQNRAAYQKKLSEMKDIDPLTANALLNEADFNYNKRGGLQKTEAGYLGYSGNDAAKNIDEGKLVKELTDGWKANFIANNSGYQVDPNTGALYTSVKGTKEYVSEAEIKRAITPILENNSDYTAYRNQKVRLGTYHLNDANIDHLTIEGNKKLVDNNVNELLNIEHKKSLYNKDYVPLTKQQIVKKVNRAMLDSGYLYKQEADQLTPQERIERYKRDQEDAMLNNAVNYGASKEGYEKIDQDLKAIGIPKWKVEQKLKIGEFAPAPKPQTYQGQIYKTPVNSPELSSSKISFNDYLNSQGITKKINVLEHGNIDEYFDKNGNKIKGTGALGNSVDDLKKQYNEFIKKDNYSKLEIIAKSNPNLKEILDQTKTEFKDKSENEIASIVEKRYNSKIKSVGTASDYITEPRNQKMAQEHKIGESSKLGDISVSNIYNENTGKMESFNTFAKNTLNLDMSKPEDIKKFTEGAKYLGTVTPKNHEGRHAFTFNGKQYVSSGSVENKNYFDPITKSYSVIANNESHVGTEINPIDFSSVGFPTMKGISVPGYLDSNGNFIKGDRYDTNHNHVAREAFIKLTQDWTDPVTHKILKKKGEYISLSTIINHAEEHNPFNNEYNVKDVTNDGGESKTKAVNDEEEHNLNSD